MSSYNINLSNIFYTGKFDHVNQSTDAEGTDSHNVPMISNKYNSSPSIYWKNNADSQTEFDLFDNPGLTGSMPKLPMFRINWGTFNPTIISKRTHQIMDINKVGAYGDKHHICEKTLPDGTIILIHEFSKLEKCQPQWLNLQKYMVQAANELGLTLIYSDMCRTVKQSDKSRAEKGDHVAPGGKSPHNYGVAADIVLLKDGVEIPNNSPLRKEFADRVSVLSGGKIAWGGNPKYYHTLYKKERHHFELRDWNKKSSPNFCKTPDRLIKRYT